MLKRIINIRCSGFQQKNAGLTLVELLITSFIISLILTAFVLILISGSETWQINNMQVEVQQEIRKAMDWMKEDLFLAGTATISNVPADGNWYNNISFMKSVGINNGNILWSSPIQFARGGAGSTFLQRTQSSTTKTIAQNLNALQFRRQASTPDLLEIYIKTQKSTNKGAVSVSTFNFTIQLRN